jgi:hypothetical protein
MVRAAQEERAKELVGQEDLVGRIRQVLFDVDPVGISFTELPDEYLPVAETITLRLSEASSEQELLGMIYEEFVGWFNESIAGPMDRYQVIAAEIWALQQPDT